MRALGIDSTRDFLVLVLVDGDDTYSEIVNEGNKKHTALLLPAVERLISAHGLQLSELDVIAAVTGPGSFTGIRVGVAAANAIAYACNIKMLEITSLELIAYNKQDGVALIDALHGNCYGGTIVGGGIENMRYYEQGELTEDIKRVYRDENDNYIDAFSALIKAKAEKGEYKQSLMPLYLRESQAEREAKK